MHRRRKTFKIVKQSQNIFRVTFKVDMIKVVKFEWCYDWLIGKSAYQLNPSWTHKCKPRILVILGVRYPSAVVAIIMIIFILYLLFNHTLCMTTKQRTYVLSNTKKRKGTHTANEIQRIVFSLTLNKSKSIICLWFKIKHF